MDKLGKPSLDLVGIVDAVEGSKDVNPVQRTLISFVTGIQKRSEVNFVYFIRHGFCLKCHFEAIVRSVMKHFDSPDFIKMISDSFEKIKYGMEYHLKEIWFSTFLISQIEEQEKDAIDILKNIYKGVEVEEDKEYFYDINHYLNIAIRENLKKVLEIYGAALYDMKLGNARLENQILNFWVSNALVFVHKYNVHYDSKKKIIKVTLWKAKDNSGFYTTTDPIQVTINVEDYKKGNENEIG